MARARGLTFRLGKEHIRDDWECEMAAAGKKIQCVNRFIELANTMANEGKSREMVSSGLMTACAVYATYVVTGNDGALRESGVDKLTDLFKKELAQAQEAKIKQAKREGKETPDDSR